MQKNQLNGFSKKPRSYPAYLNTNNNNIKVVLNSVLCITDGHLELWVCGI